MPRVGGGSVLFEAPVAGNLRFHAALPVYDVVPDGQQFVMLLSPDATPVGCPARTQAGGVGTRNGVESDILTFRWLQVK